MKSGSRNLMVAGCAMLATSLLAGCASSATTTSATTVTIIQSDSSTVQSGTSTVHVKKHKTKPKPTMTAAQSQALMAAKSYLSDGEGFSRAGLIKQLSSSYGSGFPKPIATWAVDHTGANWDAQAVIAAKGYMSDGEGFSHNGLIQQLESSYGSAFTHAQAVYAVKKVGL